MTVFAPSKFSHNPTHRLRSFDNNLRGMAQPLRDHRPATDHLSAINSTMFPQ